MGVSSLLTSALDRGTSHLQTFIRMTTTEEVATTEVEAAHIQEFIFCEKTFNKSKEDFLWFIKKAVACKTSDAYGELFMKLLKKFVDADTNKDGLVSKDHFLKLVTGFIPVGPMQEDDETLGKMFDAMDLKHTGVITFDEWLKFCLEHIEKTVAKLDPHPILNHGTNDEFKAFVIDHDSNKDGNVTQYAFMALGSGAAPQARPG